MKKSYKQFLDRREALESQWDEAYYAKQHRRGKLTARERILLLFDKGTFVETDAFMSSAKASFGSYRPVMGDGVICGYGKVQGRLVYSYAQDFNVFGGSLGSVHAEKIVRVQEYALKTGSPLVGLIDSGGARIQEGISSLNGYAGIFRNNVLSSGVIPQISVIMGPAAGGAVYSPALTDFIFMTASTSYMFVTGPNVVKEVLNETVSTEDLGGASVHSVKSGVADFVYNDDENTILGVKQLLAYLPSNNLDNAPVVETGDSVNRVEDRLRDIVPDDPDKPYDVKEVVALIVDNGNYLEVGRNHADNIFTAYAHLDGMPVAIVANQPKVMAGTLDIDSSVKAARFVNICNAYNIPIITLVDVPGFLPGTDQEHDGIIRHGAKLLYAYTYASVPKITIILRKAYGGAYIVMNSKGIGGDFSFAWPSAEIAVMGPDGAIAILYNKELAASEDPVSLKKELTQQYRDEVTNPYIADDKGFIDEVIDPAHTRSTIIHALHALKGKVDKKPKRKHGNIPL